MKGIEKLNTAEFLSKIAILKELSPDELLILSDFMEIRNYAPGLNIFKEGELGTELCIIKKGEVEVLKNDDLSEKQELLAQLSTGDFFGEMSVLERCERSATVKAIEDTEIYSLSLESLKKLEKENLEISMKFYKGFVKLIAARLRMRNEHYCFTKHTLENLKKFL